ncbi:unnamed protein product [Danaus chrysippus]|uniref:(African queen) hypothetical protein n=1 Tax=Danaus chrysippus TaxID=151541 RepID=A0A8J2VPJ7_9NEOP|nr:unnamed protein product [Danaus chrysippus]
MAKDIMMLAPMFEQILEPILVEKITLYTEDNQIRINTLHSEEKNMNFHILTTYLAILANVCQKFDKDGGRVLDYKKWGHEDRKWTMALENI